ncbi:hypothetical protein VTL71DRAFT_10136 [Oculimacula yallundae]|uniref:Cytochrome P450 n=1 Tax=Oculimacula yallundae TaxID=86028 RepID=A0ABR4BPP3_9HELO
MISKIISSLTGKYISHPIFTTLISCLLLFTLIIYITAPTQRFAINLPTLPISPSAQKKRWKWNSDTMLLEACRKFPDQVFQIWTSEGPEIIIPPAFLDELRSLPDTYLSSIAGLAEMFQSRYTTIPIEENHFGIHFTKTILTKNIGKVLPGMIDELNFVLPQQFRIVPRLDTHLSACKIHIPSHIPHSTGFQHYSKDVFIASSILKQFPTFLRGLIKNLIPQIWSIKRHNRNAANIVEEALKDQIKSVPISKGGIENSGEKNAEDIDEEPKDATHGIWELLPQELKRDYDFQGRGQLGLAAAGIHTTSRLLTHVIYSLAQYPEYAPILRQEIEDVKRGSDTEWTVEMLGRLRKLDSFVKECMRLWSGGVTSFRRKVLLPITLSNGIVIPAGSYVSAALCGISISPEIYPSPETFSPFRFYDLRQPLSTSSPIHPISTTASNQHQLTTTSPQAPFFGLGRHACPGRFFAAVEVKIVLVEMLGRYEFRLKQGEERPGDVVFNSLRIVKPSGEVEVRSLKSTY